jgi:hypothetical protein
MLNAVDVDKLKLVPLLFQTGYLTIANVTGADEYTLRFPNTEVKNCFNPNILEALLDKGTNEIGVVAGMIRQAFDKLDAPALARAFEIVLQWIPHQLHVPLEHYYHTVLFTIMKAYNFNVESEVSEAKGDLDLRLIFPDKRVFIVEFKHEKVDSEDIRTGNYDKEKLFANAIVRARKQIETQGYAKKYINEGLRVSKVPVGIVGRTDVAVEFY